MPIELDEQVGSYVEARDDGLLAFPDPPALQPGWADALADIVAFLRVEVGGDLVSVYARGSVARGTAVAGVSDVDTLFVAAADAALSPEGLSELRKKLGDAYPYATGFDIMGCSEAHLADVEAPRRRSSWHELIKTQSRLLFGRDLASGIMPFHLVDMITHAPWLEEEMRLAPFILVRAERTGEVPSICRTFTKRLLRAAFEVVMLREWTWTRDVVPCARAVARHYPEHAALLRRALELAVNPTADPRALRALIDAFAWLLPEIHAHVMPALHTPLGGSISRPTAASG